MTTALNTARSANWLRRRSTSIANEEQRTRTALEMRLLSLADANASARVRILMMEQTAPLDTTLSVPAWMREAAMRLRTMTVQVPLWLTVFVVVAGSYALHSRGTAAPTAPQLPSPFSAHAAGSDRVVIPVTVGDNAVRVGVNPTVAGSADWFWCLESDRSLPIEQHLCSSVGTLDPASGYVQSAGLIHVDDAVLHDATFFVQMYCPTGCEWQVDLASRETAAIQ